MMRSIWKKIVVACLVILGEGAFSSESNQRIDDNYEVNSKAVQLSQPSVLDDAGSRWKPSLAGTNTIRPYINKTYQTFAVVTVPVTGLHKYQPLNPRAPPVPAS